MDTPPYSHEVSPLTTTKQRTFVGPYVHDSLFQQTESVTSTTPTDTDFIGVTTPKETRQSEHGTDQMLCRFQMGSGKVDKIN